MIIAPCEKSVLGHSLPLRLSVRNHVGHRILGVYGFEDEEPGEADCMVCYERFRSVSGQD